VHTSPAQRLLTLTLTLSAVVSVICGCPTKPKVRAPRSYKHPLPPGPPYAFYLTTFGGGRDAQNTSCGRRVDGSGWYATGVYHWGCGAKLRVCTFAATPTPKTQPAPATVWAGPALAKVGAGPAPARCAVVEVLDNGPAGWVEAKAEKRCQGRGGVPKGYILDVSPKLAEHLLAMTRVGWSDCRAVRVTPVAKDTPVGPTLVGPTP
jgi:hypothetical protein